MGLCAVFLVFPVVESQSTASKACPNRQQSMLTQLVWTWTIASYCFDWRTLREHASDSPAAHTELLSTLRCHQTALTSWFAQGGDTAAWVRGGLPHSWWNYVLPNNHMGHLMVTHLFFWWQMFCLWPTQTLTGTVWSSRLCDTLCVRRCLRPSCFVKRCCQHILVSST